MVELKQIKKSREIEKFKEFLSSLVKVEIYSNTHIKYCDKSGFCFVTKYNGLNITLLNKILINYYKYDDIFDVIKEFTQSGNSYTIGWKL